MTHAPIPSRRALLALAPAALAVPAPAVAADPDAGLVALAARHAALEAESEAVAAQLEALDVALPSWPDALRPQPRDWFVTGLPGGRGARIGAYVVERWREAFAKGFYRSCMTRGTRDAFEARGREVIAAWEAHEAATQAARVASGYQALADQLDALGLAHYATERRIIDTPAHGLTGLRVKARIALAAMGEPDGTYEDQAARSVLADLIGEAPATA